MLHEAAPELNEGREESSRIPGLLFRYTKLEYLKPILEGKGLFFPKLSSFNDPFDAYIFPRLDATKAECLKFYNAILKSSGLSRASRRQRMRENRGRIDDSLIKEAHTRSIVETRAECGVLCLAESKSDILMWSHYACGHTGICLAFDTRNAFSQEARKVIYQTDYPVLSFAWFSEAMTDSLGVNGEEKKGAGHLELERALFLTKAAHWKYEAEWRIAKRFPHILRDDENGTYFPFPEESLVGVVLGGNAADSAVASVRQWIAAGPLKPQLSRARVSKTEYALEFFELDRRLTRHTGGLPKAAGPPGVVFEAERDSHRTEK